MFGWRFDEGAGSFCGEVAARCRSSVAEGRTTRDQIIGAGARSSGGGQPSGALVRGRRGHRYERSQ